MDTVKKEKLETVTLDKMQEFNEVGKAIAWAQGQRGQYPERQKSPHLPSKHTSEDARKYADEMDAFEKLKKDYDKEMLAWKERENSINSVIVDYIKDMASLDTVPEQYREKVYAYAWDNGHSDGYYEVYLKLESLVDIFH